LRELSKGQRDALLFGAMTGPMAVVCGGKSLVWAIPAVAIAWVIYAAVRKKLPEGRGLAEFLPVWILIPELLFLILAAAQTASHAAIGWQASGAWPLFPLILLALGGAAAWQDTDGIGRCAVLLTLGCVLFYATVLGASALEQREIPKVGEWTEGFPILITALSAVCGLFLPAKKGGTRFWIGTALFTALLLFATAGKRGDIPFLTAVKGIELFGILQRFEALASCVMTAGLFLMLALLAGAGGEIVKCLGIAQVKGWAVIAPAALVVWWIDEVDPMIFTVGAAIFWGVIPLLTLPVVGLKNAEKRTEKREKSS